MKRITSLIIMIMMTLMVVACAQSTITIKYETNGGSAIDSNKIILDDLDKFDLPTPTKEGYQFAGWYFDIELNNEFKADNVKNDITLYAKWIKITNKLTVTFVNDEDVSTVIVEKGEKVAEPAALTKDGYTFLGWYNSENEFDFNTKITENTILYAIWEENITNLYLDESTLKLDNNLLSFNISTMGFDIPSISVSDVTIEGLCVESASIINDIISLSIKTNAKTLDEAIEELNQKDIIFNASAFNTEKNVSLITNFNKASFTFSCIKSEYDTDNSLNMTLCIKVNNGTFASDFNKTNILLDGDIFQSTIKNVEISKNVATVNINISAEALEQFESGFDGLIYLTENSLINNWGTKVLEKVSFYQILEPKFITNTSADSFYTSLNDFSKYVSSSSLTKCLGPFSYLVNLTTGLVTTSYDICKLCGFVEDTKGPSEFEQICAKFDVINEHLTYQDAKLEEIIKLLEESKLNDIRANVSKFTTSIKDLELNTISLASYIKKGANDKTLMAGVDVPTSSLEGISQKLMKAYEDGISDDEILDILSSDEMKIYTDWQNYFATLITRIEKAADSKKLYGNSYAGYYEAVSKVSDSIKSICTTLISTKGEIFNQYDYLCTKLYLFDLTAIPAREAYRASARAALDYAISLLMQVYGGLNYKFLENSVPFMNIYKNFYSDAVEVIDKSIVKRVAPEQLNQYAYFYASKPQRFISFLPLKFEYDHDAEFFVGVFDEMEKNATAYYEDIKKNLYSSKVSSDTLNEVKIRLKDLGYVFSGNSKEVMYSEVRVMAETLGYPTSAGSSGKYRYYYLDSFESFELIWHYQNGQIYLSVKFTKCKMYDILTGELKDLESYTYNQGENSSDVIYVLCC